MIATGQRRQGVGDLAAGTVVADGNAPEAADPEVPEEPKPSSMETVSSPIDRVMEDHDEEPRPPQA